jgi:hypothetical protein
MPNRHLPTKPCAVCQRPFAWRKKWERDWEHVKYCSKKCAAQAKRSLPRTDGSARGKENPAG